LERVIMGASVLHAWHRLSLSAPPQAKRPWRLPNVTIKSFNLHVTTKERPAHLHVTTPIEKLSITIRGRNQ
jgi:hypothetical protein